MKMSKPALFNTGMVLALNDGRKTKTRRPIKPQPDEDGIAFDNSIQQWVDTSGNEYKSPFGQPGDLIWVRETTESDEEFYDRLVLSRYSADKKPVLYSQCEDKEYNGTMAHWWYPKQSCPSIHMPRWASRLSLPVTGVRVERVQDISEEDAIAEGLKAISKDGGITTKYGIPDKDGYPGSDDIGWAWVDWNVSPIKAYKHLWNSIYAKPKLVKVKGSWNGILATVKDSHYESYPWDIESSDKRPTINGVPHICYPNPWIFVGTFNVIHKNIDKVMETKDE